MKRCPTCSRVYDNDSMRFCLDDGTPLVDKLPEMPPPPTLTLPPTQENQPTMKAFQPQPSPHVYVANAAIAPIKRKRNLLIWAIVFALLMPFVAGAIVGGWVILHKRALTWHLILEVDPNAPDRTAAVRQTVDVIERRLNALGLANYEVRPQGDSNSRRIIVNLPKVQDPERLKQIIITLGKLELVHVVSPMSPSPVQTFATKEEAGASLKASGTVPENCRVLPYLERGESAGKDQNATKWVVVESPAIVDGSELRDASAVRGAYGEDYESQFSLNKT